MAGNAARSSHADDGSSTYSPQRRVCMAVDTVAKKDARVMRAATALAQAGISVTLVDIAQQRDAPRQERADGVAFSHIVMPSWYVSTRVKPWFLVKYVLMLARCVLRLVLTATDAYHAHDQLVLPACWLAAQLRRKPLIYDAHEIPFTDPVLNRWPRLRALATMLFRPLLAGCTAVIVVSPPMSDEIRRRFGGPRAILVRNIPAYRAPAPSDRLRQHLGLSGDTKIALYQGAVQPNRELDRLVRAAHYLEPNIVIVLLGAGRSWDELHALIEREGLRERVRMVAAVPFGELLSWTASADIGLVLLRPEVSANIKAVLPNKLFEFTMAGVPVLATDLPAVVEVLAHYLTGCMVTSLEPDAIAHAIVAMLHDPVGLAAMRANAYAASARELRWDVESQRLIQLYRDVLGVPSMTEHSVHDAA